MQSITGPKTGPIKIPKHVLLRSKTAEVVLELPTKEKSQGGPVDGFPDARRGRLVTKQLEIRADTRPPEAPAEATGRK